MVEATAGVTGPEGPLFGLEDSSQKLPLSVLDTPTKGEGRSPEVEELIWEIRCRGTKPG